jgi:hypothetical protein
MLCSREQMLLGVYGWMRACVCCSCDQGRPVPKAVVLDSTPRMLSGAFGCAPGTVGCACVLLMRAAIIVRVDAYVPEQ